MKNKYEGIIVVGYPKSGNTWVTRLLTDLAGVRMGGFWGDNEQNDIGFGMESPREPQRHGVCFKAHHQLHELPDDVLETYKVVYVLRDPRDIAISGAHFFIRRINRHQRLLSFFRKHFKQGEDVYYRRIFPVLYPLPGRIDWMMRAVLEGMEAAGKWCRISWKVHYRPYLDAGCFMVKYEDLVDTPGEQVQRLVDYLGLEITREEIQRVINRQSISNKKKEFKADSDRKKMRSVRAGQSQQWRHVLTKTQKDRFMADLGADLQELGYAVE